MKEIFRELKSQGALTLNDLREYTGIPLSILEKEMDLLVSRGWIVQDGDKYRIRIRLDPVLKPAPKVKNWKFDKIKAITRVRQYKYPYSAYLPHLDQGTRGTCAGQAAAYLAQVNYYNITQDIAPVAQVTVTRDKTQQTGSCFIVYDEYFRTCFSAQWIYHTSRLIAGIKDSDGEGSYCDATMDALKQYGAVLWDECLTAKTPNCAPKLFPWVDNNEEKTFTYLQTRGKLHVIDGYAEASTFETVCDLIQTRGAVVMPINIYDNYQNNGCDGLFPDPVGAPIGAHALMWDGFDRDKGELYCRHSWGSAWSLTGGISKAYFREAAGPALGILDKEEAHIGKQLYTKLTIDSNVPASYTCNGESIVSPAMVERDILQAIRATPTDPAKVKEPFIEVKNIYCGDTATLMFTFTPVYVDPEPEPPKPGPNPANYKWWQDLFRKLWNDYFYRAGNPR